GDIRGFAVQTTYTGAKRFLLCYTAKDSGRERRMVLGEFGKAPKLSPSAAKALAEQVRSKVNLGSDPWLEAKQGRAEAQAAASRQVATLGGLLRAYAEHLRASGKASWRE